MLKIILSFIFVVTSTFSKEELNFQIQNTKNRNIEVLLTKVSTDKIYVYQIQYGDTLSELSLKLKNNMDTLIKLNNIKNKNLIIVNEKLKYIEKKEKWNEI